MNPKFYILNIFLIILSYSIQAQNYTWTQSIPPSGRHLNSGSMNTPTDVIVVGGSPTNDSIRYISTTNNVGNNWNIEQDMVNNPMLKDVDFPSLNIGYAVGYKGNVLKTIDGGDNWNLQALPTNIRTRRINGVQFIDTLVGFAVGGNPSNDSIQTIIKTTDGGNTWTILRDGLGHMFNDLYFVDQNIGFVVGNKGVAYKTIDGGTTWNTVPVPGNMINRTFNGVHFVNDQIGVIVGGNLRNDSIQTIIKTTNGGTTWNIVRDIISPMLMGVDFHNSNNAYAVGRNGAVLESTDAGSTWTNVSLPNVNNLWMFNSVDLLNSSNGIICGQFGAFFIASDINNTTNVNYPPNPTVVTNQSAVIAPLTLELTADVNTDSLIYNTYFEIGLSAANLSSVYYPINRTFNDDILHTVKDTVSNLNPSTTYFYRAVIENGMDTIYGNILQTFVPQPPQPTISNLLGIYLDSNSFEMRVNVNMNNLSYSTFFEVGLNAGNLDLTFIPQNGSFNDNLNHQVVDTAFGLTTQNMYYYRCGVENGVDTIYSNVNQVYLNNPRLFNTNSDSINNNTYEISTDVNVDSIPYTVRFVSGISKQNLNSYSYPFNANFNDDLTHSVKDTLNNLMPNTQYYYRAFLERNMDTIFGNIDSFYTTTPPQAIVETQSANVLTYSSIELRALVNVDNQAYNTFFEYGSSLNLLNQSSIPANASFSDNVDHIVLDSITGLNSQTRYYFRAAIENGVDTLYGDVDSIFINIPPPNPSVNTNNANVLNYSQIEINGSVNTSGLTYNAYFEFGNSITNLTDVYYPLNASFNDNNNHQVKDTVSNLILYSDYFYRCVIENGTDTIYGNTNTIFLAPIYLPNIITLEANVIASNAVEIKGEVNVDDSPFNVFFQYGLDSNVLSNIEVPSQANFNDNNTHLIEDTIVALNNQQLYYYRIAVENGVDTIYGNIKQVFVGEPYVPNFSFEYWDTILVEYPTDWFSVGTYDKVSGSDGDYAVKLGDNIPNQENVGAVIFGVPSDNGVFQGGIPFSERPDFLNASLKYDINPGDSARVIVMLKKDGVLISSNLFSITGSSNSFVEIQFPISYNSQLTPDSLVLGFISTNFVNDIQENTSILYVDDVSFSSVNSSIPNASFENWLSKSQIIPDVWSYSYLEGATIEPFYSVNISTQAIHGNYAAMIENRFMNNDTLKGSISTTSNDDDFYDKASFPIVGKPETFHGFYKFNSVNNDTMEAIVQIFQNGTLVGFGSFRNNASVNTFSPFTCNINYPLNSVQPDSASIGIRSFSNRVQGESKLWIDDLSFDGFYLKDTLTTDTTVIGIIEKNGIGKMEISLYPNPSNHLINIDFIFENEQYFSAKIYNNVGQLVSQINESQYKKGEYSIKKDISNLTSGNYFVVLNFGDNLYDSKVLIIK